MSYEFNTERQRLFTPEGQKAFIGAALHARNFAIVGDSFTTQAVLDTLVEGGFLEKLTPGHLHVYRWTGP